MSQINKIVLLIAMQAEADNVIQQLKATPYPHESPLNWNLYSASVKSSEENVFIVVYGKRKPYLLDQEIDAVGLQQATLCCWEAVRLFNPDLIISAGTAGGSEDHGAMVGDVYVSTGSICYHDRRIPIPGFREYGIGSFPVVEAPNMVKELVLKTGVVSSGNNLTYEGGDVIQFIENNATVKDMEAAAVAEVAHMCGVNMMAVKGVTDLVEHPAVQDVFFQNLAAVTAKVYFTINSNPSLAVLFQTL
eukprot:TRINITY_DN1190_c0_g1_i3.p1 TRINITY_DN1190_c0_g1~~TRINITY_DN1190_c0_g1_i3.p1  ORF type:complete len:247 (-),score=56.19 TRINITY_DN1190_c0_g1_i3:568-1308(-)